MTDMTTSQIISTVADRRAASSPDQWPLTEVQLDLIESHIKRIEDGEDSVKVMEELVVVCNERAIPELQQFKDILGPHYDLFKATPYNAELATVRNITQAFTPTVSSKQLKKANGKWDDLAATSLKSAVSDMAETDERLSAALLEEMKGGEEVDGNLVKKIEMQKKSLAMTAGIMKILRDREDVNITVADEDDAVSDSVEI